MHTTQAVRELMHYIHPRAGIVRILYEADKSYTVEHSDLYQVYSRETGFKRYKQAQQQARDLAGK